MGLKMNFKIITKNHAADPEIEFFTNSILKPYGRATAMQVASELTPKIMKVKYLRWSLI